MEIVGYVTIKKDAKTGISAEPIEQFFEVPLRVIEFAEDGGVMVINSKGTALATFDKEDVVRSFKCSVFGDVICPPDINFADQLVYSSRCLGRKGGYNYTLFKMVVACSLAKGSFNDSILWALQ